MGVLIIDDSKELFDTLASYLQLFEAPVFEAHEESEALAILGRNPGIAVVIIDWHMPRINGLEFVRAVRGPFRNHRAKFLMITAESSMAWINEALMAGVDDYLIWPFSKGMLHHKLRLFGFSSTRA